MTTMAMDEDTRQAFASIASTLQRLDANQSAGNALQIETAREFRAGLASLNGRVDSIASDVRGLQQHVFGDAPPPSPPAVPILRQVSEQDMETDALKSHVLVLDSKVDALTKMQEEQNEMLRTITKAVGGFFGNPTVQRIGALVGALVLAWLTAKTQGVLK